LDKLLHDSRALLAPGGHLALILPYDRKEYLTECIRKENLFPSKEISVIPVPGAQPKRILIELTAEPSASPMLTGRLTIEIARHQYTDEYIRLTKDFYLKM
jgi:tRNA1Val (adenine37-N6)-methyltransferase